MKREERRVKGEASLATGGKGRRGFYAFAVCDASAARPLLVRRYFWKRDVGLPGMVRSIRPAEIMSRIPMFSFPETDCCPMAIANSCLPNSALASAARHRAEIDSGPNSGPGLRQQVRCVRLGHLRCAFEIDLKRCPVRLKPLAKNWRRLSGFTPQGIEVAQAGT